MTEPTAEQTEAITGNTRLVAEALGGLSGERLPPGRVGLAQLNDLIEGQRVRDDAALKDKLAHMAACYLGDAIIAEIGGRWVVHPQHGLAVQVVPEFEAFPFAKARKHVANGVEDSVLSFFDVTRAIATDRRSKKAGGPSIT